jgi:hypothetical protein
MKTRKMNKRQKKAAIKLRNVSLLAKELGGEVKRLNSELLFATGETKLLKDTLRVARETIENYIVRIGIDGPGDRGCNDPLIGMQVMIHPAQFMFGIRGTGMRNITNYALMIGDDTGRVADALVKYAEKHLCGGRAF